MEHYCKGRNEEEELRKDNIPMSDLPSQFSWLEVTGSTRVRTDVGNMSRLLRDEGAIVVGGCGPNTEKVVTLAEIIKRRNKHVHQVTKVGEKSVREFWEPKTEDLDPLVVTRLVPTVHILLAIRRDDEQKQGGLIDVLWGEEKKAGIGRKRKLKKNVKKQDDNLVEDVTKINLS